jgi:hypothetical protein
MSVDEPTTRGWWRLSPRDIVGNGLDQLGYLADSATVTRKFKNVLKSCGIYQPAFVDKARLVKGPVKLVLIPGLSNRRARRILAESCAFEAYKWLPKRPYEPVIGYENQTIKRFGKRKSPKGSAYDRFVPAHPRLPGASLWRPRRRVSRPVKRPSTLNPVGVQAKRGVNGPRQSPSNPDGHPLRWAEPIPIGSKLGKALVSVARETGNGEFISVLGGQTFTSTPAARQKHAKYWYFLRKRGFWRFSQHHPIGDENDTYGIR